MEKEKLVVLSMMLMRHSPVKPNILSWNEMWLYELQYGYPVISPKQITEIPFSKEHNCTDLLVELKKYYQEIKDEADADRFEGSLP